MDNRTNQFRERLVKSEHTTPSLRERYEKEMQDMLEEKLNPRARISWTLTILFMVAIGGHYGYRALTGDYPLLVRIGFLIAVVFAVGWMGVVIRMLRRGSLHRKTDQTAITNIAWYYVVALAFLYMLIAGWMGNTERGMPMVVFGLLFLIGYGTSYLMNIINQADLRTREHFLEVRYRLAELQEKLEKL